MTVELNVGAVEELKAGLLETALYELRVLVEGRSRPRIGYQRADGAYSWGQRRGGGR